jgi:hypothetical protein
MEFCCNSNLFFSKIKKYRLLQMVSMFRLLCEFVIVSEYDEMNCNFFFWSFLQCILKCRFWLYEITMKLVF